VLCAHGVGGGCLITSFFTFFLVRQVPVVDVEPWVVRAISRGLIDARMDQTAETITVTRTVQRDFGSSHWTVLQAKLRAWRDNVSALLASME